MGAISTLEAAGRPEQEVRVAGIRQTWRRAQRSDGRDIYFMDLADLAGTLRVVIDEEVYLRCRENLATRAAILITGRLDRRRDLGEPLFRVSDVQRLDRLALGSSETAAPG